MLDPTTIQWLCIAGFSFCAFMIGYNYAKLRDEDIIGNTIMYLIHNNFVRARKDSNNEWEIIPLDEK